MIKTPKKRAIETVRRDQGAVNNNLRATPSYPKDISTLRLNFINRGVIGVKGVKKKIMDKVRANSCNPWAKKGDWK